MEAYDWDGRIDYLHRSVRLYYNDDYIKFLVDTVWKIDKPVHMVDFGCGFGHLGLRLLPLFPEGSRYTGIDAGAKLIEHGRELFEETPYDAEFIAGDLAAVPVERAYDLAVCHAVLLHMTDPMAVLRKMIGCVKPGGKVIAFEPHWIGNHASYYFHGIEQSDVLPLGPLQRLFERDVRRTGGKDGNIGLKLPIDFSRLGLRDVQCRTSDKVNVYDPGSDELASLTVYEAMKFGAPGDRQSFIDGLLARGMTPDEAERQYEAEQLLSDSFTPDAAAAYAPGMKITFGTVDHATE